MKISNISIKWKLLIVCVVLVVAPTVVLGILAYQTFKSEAYQTIEKDLCLIAKDWQAMTYAYIAQMDRVLKREEVLVQQRLKSIIFDVKSMMNVVFEVNPKYSNESTIWKCLFDNIQEIKIGRSGYVFLLDEQGNYVLSKNPGDKRKSFLDGLVKKESFQNDIEEIKQLQEDDAKILHYMWNDPGYSEPRMKLAAFSYYKPFKLIIGACTYYTDFKSYELERVLQDELKYKMSAQRIGVDGYIWVINGQGEYVVSKDRLQDGENILETKDESGQFIIKEVIKKAKTLGQGETYINYYFWRNLGENQLFPKCSAVAYVPEWDWIIGASAYHKDFLKGLDMIRFHIIGIGILAITFGSLIAYLFASFISGPIKKLENLAIQAAKGDFNVEIDKQMIFKKDEVGSLASSFNVMINNLKDTMGKLKRSNDELSQYAYIVSHDLKTPLRGVHNYADFLKEDLEGKLEDEQKSYLNGLLLAVKEGETLVDDLLTFSRLDKAGANIESVNIGKFLKEVLTSLQLDTCVEVVMANDWPIVEVEVTLLRQIFQNLVQNGVKFNKSTPKRIEIGWRLLGNGFYEFLVKDNGIGIEPQYHKQLFQIFQRLHTKEEYEGTGIGLAIVKKAVTKMNGTVWLESKYGEGSTFYFTIPQKQPRLKMS